MLSYMKCAKNTQIISTPSTLQLLLFIYCYLFCSCGRQQQQWGRCATPEREDVPPPRKRGCATPRERGCATTDREMCHPREREDVPPPREDVPPPRKRGCATHEREDMPPLRERGCDTPRERGDLSLWLIENNKPSTYSCNFTDASLIYVIGYNEYFSFRYSHNF